MKHISANISLAIQIGVLIGALLGSFFVFNSGWIIITIPFVFVIYWIYQDIRLLLFLCSLIAMISMGYYVNHLIEIYRTTQDIIPSQLEDTSIIIQSSSRIQSFGYQYKAIAPEYDAKLFITIDNANLRYGDQLRVKGKTQIPENDGIKRFLLGKHIHRYATISQYIFIESNQCSGICPYMRSIDRLKIAIIERIERAHPNKVGEFLKGILIGYTDTLPDTIKESFKRTGVSHVLAVSGYNMAIIIILVYQQLINRQMPKKISFIITVIVMIIFTILTGAEASIVRAGLFAFIILLAEQVHHYVGGFRPLILCGTLLVLINPLYIGYNIGFQLSFLAVIGLIIYGQVWKTYSEGIPSIGIFSMIGETLFAQILVLPILIYYFGQISLISLIANIVIVPIIPLAMAWGSITSFFLPFDIFTYPLTLMINSVLHLNMYLSWIEWASISVPPISGIMVGILYAMIGLIYWLYRKYRHI